MLSARIGDVLSQTLQHSGALKFGEGDSEYVRQYPHLLDLADTLRNRDLYPLALAVYGWMPTILRSFEPRHIPSSIRDAADASEWLAQLPQAAVNRSWVGTSKFLHCLHPTIFPIWDRRVAEVLRLPTYHAAIDCPRRYATYVEAVHAACRPPSGDAVKELVSGVCGYSVTHIRAVEFCLFVHSTD